MNIYQMLAGFFITFMVFLRAMTMKVGTKSFTSRQITFANYFYMVFILLLTVPFMTNMLLPPSSLHIKPVLAGLIKGVMLYTSVKCTADIAKESNSSSVFAGYISLGVCSILNYVILIENLRVHQSDWAHHLIGVLELFPSSIFVFP